MTLEAREGAVWRVAFRAFVLLLSFVAYSTLDHDLRESQGLQLNITVVL